MAVVHDDSRVILHGSPRWLSASVFLFMVALWVPLVWMAGSLGGWSSALVAGGLSCIGVGLVGSVFIRMSLVVEQDAVVLCNGFPRRTIPFASITEIGPKGRKFGEVYVATSDRVLIFRGASWWYPVRRRLVAQLNWVVDEYAQYGSWSVEQFEQAAESGAFDSR